MRLFNVKLVLALTLTSALVAGSLAVVVSNANELPSSAVTFTLSNVVAAGDPDPLGGAFSFVSSPAIVSPQRITFTGTTSGIFVKSGDTLRTIVASGNPRPIGGTFSSFGPPSANASGQVAFRAGTSGIYLWTAGSIVPAVLRGDAAPGGGTLTSLGSRLALNAAGDIAFTASAGQRGGLSVVGRRRLGGSTPGRREPVRRDVRKLRDEWCACAQRCGRCCLLGNRLRGSGRPLPAFAS
jgi:hypothetical protein